MTTTIRRIAPHLGLGTVLLLAAACGKEPTGPSMEPPYLAIVARLDVPAGVSPGQTYRYHIQELSGTLGIDTTIVAAPRDTIVLPVPPATYRVTAEGLPPYCAFRDGPEQFILVPENSNTSLARYFVNCRALLTIETATDGFNADNEFFYRVTDAGGTPRSGLLAGTDTAAVDSLAPGPLTIELGAVAPNCVVTSNGGEVQHVTMETEGGATARFRIRCSDQARKPAVLDFHSSFADGASGFVIRATDPNADIERYAWDITDCHGTSVLPTGARLRRGLSSGRTAEQDTVLVVGAFETGLQASEVTGRCTAIRIEDEEGNTTRWFQQPIGTNTGQPPVPVSIGASFVGIERIDISLSVSDPDGDLAGIFGAARLRDGTLGPSDGKDDIGIFNVAGYLALPLPAIPLGNGRPEFGHYIGIIIYLLDQQGNLTRREIPMF